ncbi:16S rRNA (cytosine(1402)-N(4))-methyltransferase [Boudabousia liubingyangii]|uniref:16S rRNA (cytosine(1402)-N(4))-methyltransferase RsmH n=1 Tax=Boudabousia liubingyangii TaxID=1921764 RepID=UPI00093FF904|nr:16S rRNA (cytosine(1402)-N(4))-methyltransferase RsmH [Boudabousia liubingyangii]OKL47537.1 16S rRNA (cytosine(1402)-N(4))-methyltransferase [Boudabousia liubingyangii]
MAEIKAAEAHTPVMLKECLELLAPALERPGAIMVDCTLGMGGHTEAVLKAFPEVTVYGIDRDPQAIELASARLAPFGERFQAVHATYDQVYEVAQKAGGHVDAVLMDLGVSSLQLDMVERGFSYSRDAQLDMRMDPTQGPSAADFLNTASAKEISQVLWRYGEEKNANRIAQKIVAVRAEKPLTRTAELVEVIREALPQAAMRKGGNPAKRTFQAIRIKVNGELDILEAALPAALKSLNDGGRLVVEAYQSLEDRLVKQTFKTITTVDVPADLPFIPESAQPDFKLITRGAQRPSDQELAENPRSAPVRLRAVERLSSNPDQKTEGNRK